MRIILADPNEKTLWALKTLLDEEPGIEVIGEVVWAQQLQEMAATTGCDLVLLDRRLPGSETEDLIAGLHALEPKPIVIVMSSDTEDGRYMLKAGADAFLSKGEGPDWMLNILRQYAQHTSNSSAAIGR